MCHGVPARTLSNGGRSVLLSNAMQHRKETRRCLAGDPWMNPVLRKIHFQYRFFSVLATNHGLAGAIQPQS